MVLFKVAAGARGKITKAKKKDIFSLQNALTSGFMKAKLPLSCKYIPLLDHRG